MQKQEAIERLQRIKKDLGDQKFKGKAGIIKKIVSTQQFLQRYHVEPRNIDLLMAEIETKLYETQCVQKVSQK